MSGILADGIFLLHLAFILFVAGGALLAFRWRGIVWLHVPAVLWGTYVELSGTICPLTPLENALRRDAGGTAFSGGFIEHYLVPLVYPEDLTRGVQIALGAAVFFLNAVVYVLLWRRWRGSPGAGGGRG